MLKFIIITIIFIYVLFKVSGFILKIFDTLLGRTGSGAGRRRNFGSEHRRKKYRQPANGNVNIDYIPEEEDKKAQFKKNFRGGEYVDYEETK